MSKLAGGLLSIVFLFVSFIGCATLFNSDRDAVSFNTNPSQAEVWINGTKRGETPLTLELEPNEEYEVVFRKDGREQAYMLDNHVGAGWVILDVLGGLIPVIIDAVTGDWQELDSKAINVNLPAN
jgi:hypothetical protein